VIRAIEKDSFRLGVIVLRGVGRVDAADYFARAPFFQPWSSKATPHSNLWWTEAKNGFSKHVLDSGEPLPDLPLTIEDAMASQDSGTSDIDTCG
jgi:hypothetical protein